MPDTNGLEKELNNKLYPKDMLAKNNMKSADAVINWSKEEPWVVDLNNLKKANQQADYAIIKIKGDIYDLTTLTNNCNEFKRVHRRFKKVIIYDNKNTLIYPK